MLYVIAVINRIYLVDIHAQINILHVQASS